MVHKPDLILCIHILLLPWSESYAFIEQHRGLQSAASDHGLHILPVTNQLNVGVIKQQPLLQLFAEGVSLIVVPKVANDALEV